MPTATLITTTSQEASCAWCARPLYVGAAVYVSERFGAFCSAEHAQAAEEEDRS